MTRISTSAANQSALMDLMRAQRDLFDAQQQLTTGKKAQGLKGIGYKAETISATRAAFERSKSYEEAAIRTVSRLEAQDLALERVSSATADLRAALTSKQGDFVMHQVREAFGNVTAGLNTSHAGSYIFAGTRSDAVPVTVTTLDQLIPLGSAADAFANNDRKPQVQLDQNLTLEVGMLAEDVGGEVMAAFKRIADYDAGVNGPFATPMTAAQEAFITAEIQSIVTTLDNVNARVAENGAKLSQVENIEKGHADRQSFLERLLGEMEDVDMAEAATRFQQAQTALDVSAKTFSTLSQVSLLPFLR
ncbi:flagellin [Maricaulis sp. CAU 1757]